MAVMIRRALVSLRAKRPTALETVQRAMTSQARWRALLKSRRPFFHRNKTLIPNILRWHDEEEPGGKAVGKAAA